MLFQRKLDRAREVQRRLRGLDDEKDAKKEAAEDPEAPGAGTAEDTACGKRRPFWRRRKRDDVEGGKLETEKGDLPALLLSAFITLFLPAAGILILFAVIALLLFRLF